MEDYNFGRVGSSGGTTIGRPGITESGGDVVTIHSVGENDYSGVPRMRPASEEDFNNFDNNDLTSLNLSE